MCSHAKYWDRISWLLYGYPYCVHACSPRCSFELFIQVDNFNRETTIEMKNIKDLPNYIISLYKAAVWKNRGLAQLRDINEQAVINSLDSALPFYIKHILKGNVWVPIASHSNA